MRQSRNGAQSSAMLVMVAAALAATVGGGIVYGRLIQRWGVPSDLTEAGRQLETMPAQFGDWRLVAEGEMDATAIEMLACAGYVNRTYENSKTGEKVSLAVVLGPPGTIAVHTPEICYTSVGFTRGRTRYAELPVGGTSHTFWHLDFDPKDLGGEQFRVYYAWFADGVWQAADAPRFEFAGKRKLYKLQLSAAVSELEGELEGKEAVSDAGEAFLRQFLAADWTIEA